jgi:putrescine transport system permease protein
VSLQLADKFRQGRRAVIAAPYLWLLIFFLIPFAITLKISLSESVVGQPPYSPLFQWLDDGLLRIDLHLGNFQRLIDDDLYLFAYFNSIKLAGVSTVLTLLVGYPMAYGIARSSPARRSVLLMLVVMPFWTSFLIRIYAWMGILKQNGLLNNLLIWTGIISEPLEILNTPIAIYIGMTYAYLPFMILPLYATLEKLDGSLLEAASDLGARPWDAFLNVTLPQSLPGVFAGSLLVFIPAVGDYVTPSLLGGPDTLMIGNVLFNEFFANRDWPTASAVATVLLVFLVGPIMLFNYMNERQSGAKE